MSPVIGAVVLFPLAVYAAASSIVALRNQRAVVWGFRGARSMTVDRPRWFGTGMAFLAASAFIGAAVSLDDGSGPNLLPFLFALIGVCVLAGSGIRR